MIQHEHEAVEIVDVATGEHFRLTLGETNTADVNRERTEVLVQLALIDSKVISKGFAEIITHLERKGYLIAFGAFQGLNYRCKFLGTILETTTRQNTTS